MEQVELDDDELEAFCDVVSRRRAELAADSAHVVGVDDFSLRAFGGEWTKQM